jgi:hypothetical protein
MKDKLQLEKVVHVTGVEHVSATLNSGQAFLLNYLPLEGPGIWIVQNMVTTMSEHTCRKVTCTTMA